MDINNDTMFEWDEPNDPISRRREAQRYYVMRCLDDAKKWNVDADVVYYALTAMKEAKGIISIDAAMEIGMTEMDV